MGIVGSKWTPAQHRKYAATRKAQRLAREKGGLPSPKARIIPNKVSTLIEFALQELKKDRPDIEVALAYLILARATTEEH